MKDWQIKKAEEYKAMVVEKANKLSNADKRAKALDIIESRSLEWWLENGLDVACCKLGAAMRFIQAGELQEQDIYKASTPHTFN